MSIMDEVKVCLQKSVIWNIINVPLRYDEPYIHCGGEGGTYNIPSGRDEPLE
jgi:hypothetical protein